MIIPIRCFTCNGVIGNKWEPFQKEKNAMLKEGKTEMEATNEALLKVSLEQENYCCRRMLISHVDVIDNMLLYSKVGIFEDKD